MVKKIILLLYIFPVITCLQADSLIVEISGYTQDYVNLFIYKGDMPSGSMEPGYTTSFSLEEEAGYNTINLFYSDSDSVEQSKNCSYGSCCLYLLDSLGNPVQNCIYQTKYGPKFNIGRLPSGRYIVKDLTVKDIILDTISIGTKYLANIFTQTHTGGMCQTSEVIDERDSIKMYIDLGVVFKTDYTAGDSVYIDVINNSIKLTCADAADANIKSDVLMLKADTLYFPPLNSGWHNIYNNVTLIDSFLVYSAVEVMDTFNVVPEKPIQGDNFYFEFLTGQSQTTKGLDYANHTWYAGFCNSCDTCEKYFSIYYYLPTMIIEPPCCWGPLMPSLFPSEWSSTVNKFDQFKLAKIKLNNGFGYQDIPPGTYNVYYSNIWVGMLSSVEACLKLSVYKIGEITVLSNTSVVEQRQKNDIRGFSIQPNPVSSSATIYLNQTGDSADVFIYNLDGESVACFININSKTVIWDTSGLKNGLYVIKAMTGNTAYSCKVMLQN